MLLLLAVLSFILDTMGGGEPSGRGPLRCSGLVTGCWKQKLASDSPPDSCLHMGGNRGPEGLCQPRGCPALATFWTGGHWSAAAPPLTGGRLPGDVPQTPPGGRGEHGGTSLWRGLATSHPSLGPPCPGTTFWPSGPAVSGVLTPLCHTCPGGGAHSLGFLNLRPGPQSISDAPLLVAPPSFPVATILSFGAWWHLGGGAGEQSPSVPVGGQRRLWPGTAAGAGGPHRPAWLCAAPVWC